MKKRQRNSARASALQIIVSTALLCLSAVLLATSFTAAPIIGVASTGPALGKAPSPIVLAMVNPAPKERDPYLRAIQDRQERPRVMARAKANPAPQEEEQFQQESQDLGYWPDLPAATDYTHTGITTGNWNTTTDWTPTGFPNAIGDIGRYGGTVSITTTQNVVAGITAGSIILQGSNNNSWIITLTNAVTMNNGGGGATISNTNTNAGLFNILFLSTGTLTLADDLLISLPLTRGG